MGSSQRNPLNSALELPVLFRFLKEMPHDLADVSNIFSISNRYSGCIGSQMLWGWVTQVALSLGIHLAVAGSARPTLSFLGPSLGSKNVTAWW